MKQDTDIMVMKKQLRHGINALSIVPIGVAIIMAFLNPALYRPLLTSSLGAAGVVLFISLVSIQRIWLRRLQIPFEKELDAMPRPVGYAAGMAITRRQGFKLLRPMIVTGFPAIFLGTLGPIAFKIYLAMHR